MQINSLSEVDHDCIVEMASYAQWLLETCTQDAGQLRQHLDILVGGLRGIITENGWPRASIDGENVSRCAWYIAHSADHDVAFQMQCHELMKACPKGDVRPADLASLDDRIRINQGQPQYWGTQFTKKEGRKVLCPIMEPHTVNERRASIGLPRIPMLEIKNMVGYSVFTKAAHN